jgi:MFS family permease
MVLPLLGALLSHVALPSTGKPQSGDGGAIEGFREIYTNRSAKACLLGNMLTSAMAQGIYVYSFSFLRERFMVAPGWTGVVSSAASVLFLLGSVASGWLIERHGRKRVAVVGALLLSVITLYTRLPILWISVASIVVGHFFGALRFSANNSLSLEQVPDYRGSMMSMNSASYRIGGALGAGLGGIVLVLHGWETLGAALALVGISGMLVYHILSADPVETQQIKNGPA